MLSASGSAPWQVAPVPAVTRPRRHCVHCSFLFLSFCLATRLHPQIKEKLFTWTNGFCLHVPFVMGSVTALQLHARYSAPVTRTPGGTKKIGWGIPFLVKEAKETYLTVAFVAGGSQGTFGHGAHRTSCSEPEEGQPCSRAAAESPSSAQKSAERWDKVTTAKINTLAFRLNTLDLNAFVLFFLTPTKIVCNNK